jgi:hypothetical protein
MKKIIRILAIIIGILLTPILFIIIFALHLLDVFLSRPIEECLEYWRKIND